MMQVRKDFVKYSKWWSFVLTLLREKRMANFTSLILRTLNNASLSGLTIRAQHTMQTPSMKSIIQFW